MGHWRSGTTFLHDLISLDEQFTFPSTLQCFLPNQCLITGRFLLKFDKYLIPDKRPQDNVATSFSKPQERQRGYTENRLPRQGFPTDDTAMIATLSNREWGEIDFIIYSPDGAAVALQYNPEKMDLPRVIKVIRDGNSTDMIQQARQKNITAYLDNHLAAQLAHRTINKQSIPVELYKPVAKLLQTPDLT